MCLKSWFVFPNLWGSGVTELLFSFLFTDWNRESQESLGQSGEDHWRLSTDEEGECNSHGKTETKIGIFFFFFFSSFFSVNKTEIGWKNFVEFGASRLISSKERKVHPESENWTSYRMWSLYDLLIVSGTLWLLHLAMATTAVTEAAPASHRQHQSVWYCSVCLMWCSSEQNNQTGN